MSMMNSAITEQPVMNQPMTKEAVLSCRGLGKTYTQGKYSVDVLSGIAIDVQQRQPARP
jgi:lipoprotein-releasing system ATP-binding protein